MSKKPKSLADLYATWDAKLAKSGFDDIENRRTGKIKRWSGVVLNPRTIPLHERKTEQFGSETELTENHQSSVLSKSSQAEYYRMAGRFLYDYRFNSPLEKKVWSLHQDGRSYKEIVKILYRYRLTWKKVRLIVERLRDEMLQKK